MTKRAQWRVRTVLWAVFTTAVLCSISFNKDFLLSERTYYDQNEDELKPQKDQPRPDGRDDSSLTAFMEAMARTATTLATTTTTKEKTTTITTLAFGNLTYPSHPTSRLLPKRLVSVFGLESSGTTFFTSLLARIANVTERDIFEGMRFNKTSSSWEFQHLSLPWGSSCNGTLKVVPVMYPAPCIHMNVTYSDDLKPHSSCPGLVGRPGGGHKKKTIPDKQMVQDPIDVYPHRFFVNITSHILWYRQHGVQATAVVMMRDVEIGRIARSFQHCPNPAYAHEEAALGLRILRDAVETLSPLDDVGINNHSGNNNAAMPHVVVVSYETLMHLQAPYLNGILKRLTLPTVAEQHFTSLRNGNMRYIQPWEKVKEAEDAKEAAKQAAKEAAKAEEEKSKENNNQGP